MFNAIPVITGLGLVTPLGACAGETCDALLAGRYITDHARTRFEAHASDRVHALATRAACEAVAESNWATRAAEPMRTALVIGTSKGAIETFSAALSHMSTTTYDPAGHLHGWGLSSITSHIRNALPTIDGPSLTVSAACASGLHALIRAALMIRAGEADRVLVVAAEASVNPLFLASFKRLGVLPREGFGCRPFDEDRDGFLMSEAAATVCLESAETTGSTVRYARIDRFALGGDATHMTGSDPGGSTLRRLVRCVVNGRPVDLVHAHGTGTISNDPIELAAFDDECVAGEMTSPPRVYSHKGALGHSLGAAGLVSIVLNCLSHRRGVIPPNVQTRKPLATRTIRIARDVEEAPVKRSLAVAAGFGGPMAVVSLVSP